MILLDVTQTFLCNLIVGDVSCITRVSPSSDGGCQARVQWSDINTLSSAATCLHILSRGQGYWGRALIVITNSDWPENKKRNNDSYIDHLIFY